MSPRLRSIVTVGLLATATYALYLSGIGSRTLEAAEDVILRQAQAAGSPLFFHVPDGSWLLPIPVYATRVFGLQASLVIASLNVGLCYIVARRLLAREWLAVAAALILALSPVHGIYGQRNLDAIHPVPFVLAWLLCVLAFFDARRPWLLFVAGLCLGVGVYTQPAAPIAMAAFVLVTLGALGFEGHQAVKPYLLVMAGFMAPLLLMVPWFVMHPEAYPETMGAWAIHKAHLRSPLDGVRAFLNWNTLSTRASIYWEMFSPSFLYFRGGQWPFAPPLLVPLSVLAPIGGWRALTAMRAPVALLIVGGLLAAPLAASTFGAHFPIDGALSLVVFIVLLSGLGAASLLESREAWKRAAGVALLLLIPAQYFFFL